MATKYHNLSEYDPEQLPSVEDVKKQSYAIVVADWNAQVTFALLEGAYDSLIENGVNPENILVKHVPGTFELTYAASVLQKSLNFDAVIAIGCVIQGETPHFTFICEGVAHGLSMLNAESQCPVIFSVLTTNTLQQALDRAGGKLGNKGVEGAITALKMANLFDFE